MRLALKAAAFLLATTSLVGAETATKSVGDQLKAAGYTNVRTKLSGINRFRVTGTKSGRDRVIVVNTRTGRIVRDFIENEEGGFSGDDLDDDDDDDDDDDFEGPGDDDDDNESEDDSDGDDDDDGGEDDSDGDDDD